MHVSAIRHRTLLAASLMVVATAGPASAEPFWNWFGRGDSVAADPAADYSLTQDDGPWLIMAATFSGEGSEQQARDLALELRGQHQLKTYLHDVKIDLTAGTTGLGVDRYGAPLRMRYRKGDKAHEWAVLVGDFASVDDRDAQRALTAIKSLHPDALKAKDGHTTQSLAYIRSAQTVAVNRLRSNKQLGPMRAAFITRNPLLPREYFAPKGVDKFVEKMNKGVEHSLLDAEGRYTVKVATFRGKGGLEAVQEKAKRSRRGDGLSDSLHQAALDAHTLVERMREQNWEAYEFHDRHESIVTVGVFNAVQNAGRPVPQVQEILQTFGAGYDTPADPLLKARLEAHVGAEARQRLQSFNNRFNGQHGQVAGGYQPKFARAEPKNPNSRIITFDIHPHVVEIPKRSISSSFAWRR